MPRTLAELNAVPRGEFVTVLGEVFEHAPWVAEAVAEQRPFPTVLALHQAMLAVLAAAPEPRLLDFFNKHPDLAGPAARTTPLTADSRREQAGAGLDRLTAEETATLAAANARYRARFGFPFIICALRHSQDSIFAELETRLHRPSAAERRAALDEIARISALRLVRQVEGEGVPQLYGALSTHLLDSAAGKPAPGIPIELHLLSRSGAASLVAGAVSNADGRTGEHLIRGRPVLNGTWELRFTLGRYFAERGIPSFLDVVPIRFTTSEPEAHYHIPLLFTAWSYTTYRGS